MIKDKKEIVELRRSGIPVREIASTYDVSDKRIYQILNEHDFQVEKKWRNIESLFEIYGLDQPIIDEIRADFFTHDGDIDAMIALKQKGIEQKKDAV